MGCTCKDFEENWPCINDTAIDVSLNWVMVIICSGNGLSPVYWQPMAWLNTNQLVTGLKGTTMKLNKNSTVLKTMHLKMASTGWKPLYLAHMYKINLFYLVPNVLTNCSLQCPHETKHQMAFLLAFWKFLIKFSFSFNMFNQNHSCLTMFNWVLYTRMLPTCIFFLWIMMTSDNVCKHARRKCNHSFIKSVVWIVRSLTMLNVFN